MANSMIKYRNKDASNLQKRLVKWLKEEVGIDPAQFKTKAEAFNEGVRLCAQLRTEFSKSPANADRREELRLKKIAAAKKLLASYGELPGNGSVAEDEEVDASAEDEEVDASAEDDEVDASAEDEEVDEEVETVKPAPPRGKSKTIRSF